MKNAIGKPRPDLIDRCLQSLAEFLEAVRLAYDAMNREKAALERERERLESQWRAFEQAHEDEKKRMEGRGIDDDQIIDLNVGGYYFTSTRYVRSL